MAKDDNTMWVISMSVIAIVAIVAVFGLVRMTGYSIAMPNGIDAYNGLGHDIPAASYNIEIKLITLQAQTEKELKQQYGNDIKIVWVKFVYGDKAAIGGVVLNQDGSYNTQATDGLYNLLKAGSSNTSIYTIPAPATLRILAADQTTAITLGTSGANDILR
jgi:hypothetical protein